MLKPYLSWFEDEPVDAVVPAKGAEFMPDLAALGAFHAAKRTRRIRCRECGKQMPRQVYEAGDHLLRCLDCGGNVEWLGPPYLSVQLRHQWLPEALNAQMGGGAAMPEELLKDRLWRLVDAKAPRGSVPVVLLRCGWSVDYAAVIAAIRKVSPRRVIVLTTSRVHSEQIVGAGRAVVPLASVAKLNASGLWLDREELTERCLRGNVLTRKVLSQSASSPHSNGLWFELAPDRSWLRVNGRVMRLWGKQRAFVASIEKAHKRNFAHKRFADALNDAEYEGDVRSLKQVSKRKDFSDFIGIRDGLVWIRDDVD
ncbi:hypothetical protein [Lysobacter sp. Hz 25]|uniref:hypothetical protein n=1 Tax=Lysobacter sp. Hz 25 TaxID=3383698 RepID=UPI0038D4DE87